jgi:hypothetical protein
VSDSVGMAGTVEGVAAKTCGWYFAVLRKLGELDSVIGEHGVDAVRKGSREPFEECGSGSHICFFDKFEQSEHFEVRSMAANR